MNFIQRIKQQFQRQPQQFQEQYPQQQPIVYPEQYPQQPIVYQQPQQIQGGRFGLPSSRNILNAHQTNNILTASRRQQQFQQQQFQTQRPNQLSLMGSERTKIRTPPLRWWVA